MSIYTPHTVTVGRSLFRPRPSCRPFRARYVALQLVLDTSAWWSLEEWEYDRDYHDWNKGPGLTAAFSRNNVNAVFIAWRPLKGRKGFFEICSYVNDDQGKWITSKPIVIGAREVAVMNVSLSRNYIHTDLKAAGQRVRSGGTWRRPWYNRYRWSGLSIGGKDNADGPWYGGRAHRSMRIYSAYQITKLMPA